MKPSKRSYKWCPNQCGKSLEYVFRKVIFLGKHKSVFTCKRCKQDFIILGKIFIKYKDENKKMEEYKIGKDITELAHRISVLENTLENILRQLNTVEENEEAPTHGND